MKLLVVILSDESSGFSNLRICLLGLGLLGVLLPVLPTTPFLLCAAFFFSKSSERFHKFVLDLPYFGKLVRDYQRTKAIDQKVRNHALLIMLVFLSFSIYMVRNSSHWVQGLLIGIGLIGLWVLLRIPTKK